MALTDKQERFCREYLLDLNATKAAQRAGYSKASSRSIGSENLAKPDIANRVQGLQLELANRLDIDAQTVVRELAACGLANAQDYVDSSGNQVPLHLLTREQAKAVQEYKTTTTKTGTTSVSLKLVDKRASLVDVGRHLGIFEADNEQRQPEASTPAADLAAARKIAFALRLVAEDAANSTPDEPATMN
jgi:phage terminase small subunit